MTPVCATCGQGACGCCDGRNRETPRSIENRPGLPALRYRIGTQSQFKESLLARVSTSENPTLRRLGTDESDPTHALLDAFAVMADVITFYQERLANEHYLRTAQEPTSVQGLLDLIGYVPHPGVAASCWLAFTLDTGPAAPALVGLEVGLKVQSMPGPGEVPQTFETVESCEARPQWNALVPRQSRVVPLGRTTRSAWLRGSALQLRPGDVLLLVGNERLGDPQSDQWDVRRIERVDVDRARDLTRVEWAEALGWARQGRVVEPTQQGARAYVFRARASLFGHNAGDPKLLPTDVRQRFGIANDADPWPKFTLTGVDDDTADVIHLDGTQIKPAPGAWVVLSHPGYQELYSVAEVAEDAREMFGLAGKTTRLRLVGENLNEFEQKLRETVVFVDPEALLLADEPIFEPLPVDTIEVEGRHTFERGRRLIVTGPRAHVRAPYNQGPLNVIGSPVDIEPGSILEVLTHEGNRWTLLNAAGQALEVQAGPNRLEVVPAPPSAPVFSEMAIAETVEPVEGRLLTELGLAESLTHIFDRAATRVLANVVLATHGESSSAVLGSGDPTARWQSFALSKGPLTHVPANTADGIASTLEVRVNGIRWSQVRSFFGRGPKDRVYTTRTNPEGREVIRLGDGREGARAPAGQNNVQAFWRTGLGRIGHVRAETLSLLMTRPLGVRSTRNPLPATGGQDPEGPEGAREAAPRTVKTLERVVSLEDHADFARTFAGIAKAHAEWVWMDRRAVYLTVAGDEGDEVPANGETMSKLRSALLLAGPHVTLGPAIQPVVPVRLGSYRSVPFRLGASLRVHEDHEPADVLSRARDILYEHFGFHARDFGQAVRRSHVIAILGSVEGVIAVRMTALHRADAAETLEDTLAAEVPAPGSVIAEVQPAELVTLAPGLSIDPDDASTFSLREWLP